jgi:hypothetical protein
MRMIAMIVFGRIPKAAELVGEVINVAKSVVQRVDNILRKTNKNIQKRLHHNVKSIANSAHN